MTKKRHKFKYFYFIIFKFKFFNNQLYYKTQQHLLYQLEMSAPKKRNYSPKLSPTNENL
jgi:hypothetical protein